MKKLMLMALALVAAQAFAMSDYYTVYPTYEEAVKHCDRWVGDYVVPVVGPDNRVTGYYCTPGGNP